MRDHENILYLNSKLSAAVLLKCKPKLTLWGGGGGRGSEKKEKLDYSVNEWHLTSSTVFLLLVSLRVSSTKLSQRPLQSSGSSAEEQTKSLYRRNSSRIFTFQHERNSFNITDTATHNELPFMRSVIWICTGPFSRLWTTMLAILVRWPMFPLLAPPSALRFTGRWNAE